MNQRRTAYGIAGGLLLVLIIASIMIGAGMFTDSAVASMPPASVEPQALTANIVMQQDDSKPPASTADHSQFEELQQEFATGPEVTAACLRCHTEAAAQIHETLHWTWEYVNPDTGQELGKKNVINNYCVAIDSNEPRCTSCHVGYGYANDEFDFTSENNVDCLVCHDTTGDYKKFPVGAGHPVYETKEFPPGSGKMWEPLDLANIAQNVGATSRNTCGACHFYGGGGAAVKHGDLDPTMANPSYELDVHMSPDGENFTCATCHVEDSHSVSGSRYQAIGKDTHGVDLPASDGNPATCESCHGLRPMQDEQLNDHVDQIACQTCHIPTYAREMQTKMWWDWSTAGRKDAEGKGIVEKDDNGWVTYDTKKGDFVWEKNVTPEYIWFNGTVTYTNLEPFADGAETVPINVLHGGPDDPDSRIWPVKLFKGIQPYDSGNNTLAVPHLFGKDENAYWKSYDWGLALEAGMAAYGADYSGEYGWIETEMLWPLNHMIAPKEQAVSCESCHEDGLLDGMEGVYMPGRDHNELVHNTGVGLAWLAVVGIVVHGGFRFRNGRKNGKNGEK